VKSLRNIDARLVAPAVTTWAAALIGARLATSHALAVAILLLGAAALLALRRATVAWVLCAAAVAAAASLLVAALRAPTTGTGRLQALARDHPAVTARVVVTGDPQVQQAQSGKARFFGKLIVLSVSMREVRVDRHVVRLRSPVLVLAHGDAWTSLLPSQRLTAYGTLLPARPGDTIAFALAARGPPTEVQPPSLLQRVVGRVRAGLRDSAAPLPHDEAGLLPGLVDGDTSRLPDSVRADFRTTGLTHLVAVSGANVAIVAAAAFGLARVMRLGLRGRAALAALTVAGFVMLARPSPSVLRAAVMGALGLAALATGRHRAGVPALAAAVLMLLLAEPSLAQSDGFALSVLATAGLLLVAPRLRDRFRRFLPQWFAESLAVAVAAQLMTTPYIAMRFERVSVLTVPANLLAAPAVPPATVLGVAAAVIAPVCLPVARLVAAVAYLPTAWLTTVARDGSAVPGAATTWPHGALGAILLAACFVAGFVIVRLYRRRVELWTRGRANGGGAGDADRR
jgi:competence protein ComEC